MTTTTTFPPAAVAAAITRGLANANDCPRPTADANRPTPKHAALVRNFRDSAWEHLEKDDLPQASNKAWGLVAETVKDISAQHGHIIHSHRAIMEVITELARLVDNHGDPATARWMTGIFQIARDLHTNFYENELSDYVVIGGLIQCAELSDLLYRRFAR